MLSVVRDSRRVPSVRSHNGLGAVGMVMVFPTSCSPKRAMWANLDLMRAELWILSGMVLFGWEFVEEFTEIREVRTVETEGLRRIENALFAVGFLHENETAVYQLRLIA